MAEDNNQIRVFLSSTFSDMQLERDALVKLFREIATEGMKRGVAVSLVDLRWGVTDDQKRTGKVISTCLQEIDNARPFFIGMIGDRYGWVPTDEELELNPGLLDRFPQLKEYCRLGLSITEIEMRYGVIDTTQTSNSLFLIKENSSAENARHAELRALLSSGPMNCLTYSSVNELTNRVREVMYDYLRANYPLEEDLTELERSDRDQRYIASKARRDYIPYGDYIKKLDTWLADGSQYLVVTGVKGTGKTTLISEWLAKGNLRNYKVFYHFIGQRSEGESHVDLQRHLLARLENEYGYERSALNSTDDDLSPEINEAAKLAEANGDKWVVVIDGLDRIKDDAITKILVWWPEFPSCFRVLLSTHNADLTYQRLCETQNYPSLEISFPDEESCREIIRVYLGKYGKALDGKIIERIVSVPLFRNPYLLRLLLDALISFGWHEHLSEYIDYYLAAEDKVDFYKRLLQQLEKDYGAGIVKDIVSLLCVVKNGLSEEDIINVLGLEPIEWSMVFCGIQQLLRQTDGRYRYVDFDFTKSVMEYYEYSDEFDDRLKPYRQRLIGRLEENPERIVETAYQYYHLRDWESLYRLLMKSDQMMQVVMDSDRLFAIYWMEIQEQTSYLLSDYLEVEFIEFPDWDADEQIFFLAEIIDCYFQEKELTIKLLEKATALIEKRAKDSSVWADYHSLVASNYTCIAQRYIDLSRYDDADDYLRKAKTLLASSDEPEDSMLYLIEGNLAYARGDFDEALRSYTTACDLESEDEDGIPWKYTNALGLALTKLGRLDEAEENLEKSLDAIREGMVLNTLEGAMVSNNLGLVRLDKGDYDKALEYFEKSIQIYKEILIDPTTAVAVGFCNMGEAYYYKHQYDEAIEYFKEAAGIQGDILERSPEMALFLCNLGNCYMEKGDMASALECLTNGVAIYWEICSMEHPSFLRSSVQLMDVCLEAGEYATLDTVINDVMQRSENELGADNYMAGFCHMYRAELLKETGENRKKILAAYRKAEKIFAEAGDEEMAEDIRGRIKELRSQGSNLGRLFNR